MKTSSLSRDDILNALRGVRHPLWGEDIVSLGYVRDITLEKGEISVSIELPTPSETVREKIRSFSKERLLSLPTVKTARIDVKTTVPSSRSATADVLPGVKNVVAIASGKGGVGKSTVCAHLALSLARLGTQVGILDADIFGPTIPTLLGIREKPVREGNRILPVSHEGLKVMSMGFFMSAGDVAIMRGPMLHNVMRQFTTEVVWGDLDYLLMDLPPGTGDVQLSLLQMVPLMGTVIVSTPQEVSLRVAQRTVLMCRKLNAPVIGFVENMSHFVCRHCGQREEIFGSGGARRAAKELGIPFLGDVPLDTAIRLSEAESPHRQAFITIAENLANEIVLAQQERGERADVLVTIEGRDLRIEWPDGQKSHFPGRFLRLECRCAYCSDELTGKNILREDQVPEDVSPLGIDPVGRYGIRIRWSDGHATGIYTFERLRQLHP